VFLNEPKSPHCPSTSMYARRRLYYAGMLCQGTRIQLPGMLEAAPQHHGTKALSYLPISCRAHFGTIARCFSTFMRHSSYFWWVPTIPLDCMLNCCLSLFCLKLLIRPPLLHLTSHSSPTENGNTLLRRIRHSNDAR
jgi:hypothetical protein